MKTSFAAGDRTVDEMAHAWVDVTYLEPDELTKLVAERKTKAAKPPFSLEFVRPSRR